MMNAIVEFENAGGFVRLYPVYIVNESKKKKDIVFLEHISTISHAKVTDPESAVIIFTSDGEEYELHADEENSQLVKSLTELINNHRFNSDRDRKYCNGIEKELEKGTLSFVQSDFQSKKEKDASYRNGRSKMIKQYEYNGPDGFVRIIDGILMVEYADSIGIHFCNQIVSINCPKKGEEAINISMADGEEYGIDVGNEQAKFVSILSNVIRGGSEPNEKPLFLDGDLRVKKPASCVSCGAILEDDAVFCVVCGLRISL